MPLHGVYFLQVLFDLLVAGFVLLVAALGARKGFAWQLAALFSPVAGVGIGWPLSAALAPSMGPQPPLDRWSAFGLLYLLISLAVHLLALGFRKGLQRCRLEPWDRHVGFVVGGVKGFGLALALTAGALTLFAERRGEVRSTRMGTLMGRVVDEMRPALPAALLPYLEPLRGPVTSAAGRT